MDYVNQLVEIGNKLDAMGMTKAADTVDSVLRTVAEVRQVTAQYESGLPYWIHNQRCWGNCYRQKRGANPSKPAQEVWMDCWSEYNEAVGGKDEKWNKYAESQQPQRRHDDRFVNSVRTKIASGVHPGFAINGEIEDRIAEPFMKMIASADALTKLAELVEDAEFQAQIASLAVEMIKEAQSRWQDIGRAVGKGVGAIGGGLLGGAAGSLAGPIGTGVGGAAGAALGQQAVGNMGEAVGGALGNMWQGGKDMYNRVFNKNSPQAQMNAMNQFMGFAQTRVQQMLNTPNITNPAMKQQLQFAAQQIKNELLTRAKRMTPAAKKQAMDWVNANLPKFINSQIKAMQTANKPMDVGADPAAAAGGAPPPTGTPMGPGGGGGAPPAPTAFGGDPIMNWVAQNVRGRGGKKKLSDMIARMNTIMTSMP
jgi:hypothetical protein